MSNINNKKLFYLTDCDGGKNDVGLTSYLEERVTADKVSTASKKFQRCIILEVISPREYAVKLDIRYVVAVIYSNKTISQLDVGEWVDAKEIAGFQKYDDAVDAFNNYGLAYLPNSRLVWSEIRRVTEAACQ